MENFTLHYELRGRMSLEDAWTTIGFSSTKELLDGMIERQKAHWKHLVWNTYRAAPRLK